MEEFSVNSIPTMRHPKQLKFLQVYYILDIMSMSADMVWQQEIMRKSDYQLRTSGKKQWNQKQGQPDTVKGRITCSRNRLRAFGKGLSSVNVAQLHKPCNCSSLERGNPSVYIVFYFDCDAVLRT
eukprot:scaffold38369_cov15-Tisochrysis_lutea.AAC.1